MGSCVCASVPVCGRVVCLFFLLPSPFLLLVFSPWLAARNSFWIASCPYRCCGVRGVHARCCPYLSLSVFVCPYLSVLSLSVCLSLSLGCPCHFVGEVSLCGSSRVGFPTDGLTWKKR